MKEPTRRRCFFCKEVDDSVTLCTSCGHHVCLPCDMKQHARTFTLRPLQ